MSDKLVEQLTPKVFADAKHADVNKGATAEALQAKLEELANP